MNQTTPKKPGKSYKASQAVSPQVVRKVEKSRDEASTKGEVKSSSKEFTTPRRQTTTSTTTVTAAMVSPISIHERTPLSSPVRSKEDKLIGKSPIKTTPRKSSSHSIKSSKKNLEIELAENEDKDEAKNQSKIEKGAIDIRRSTRRKTKITTTEIILSSFEVRDRREKLISSRYHENRQGSEQENLPSQTTKSSDKTEKQQLQTPKRGSNLKRDDFDIESGTKSFQTPKKEVTTTTSSSSAIKISPSKADVGKINDDRENIVTAAYRTCNRSALKGLSAGIPDAAIYGENRQTSMSNALHLMNLDSSNTNVFCDVGSGSGLPCFHAACKYPNLTVYGFENDGIRWLISQNNQNMLLNNAVTKDAMKRVCLAHADLTHFSDFGPCTHIFSFDTGFPPEVLKHYAKAVNASQHVQIFASFQNPRTLETAGFEDIELLHKVSMSMIGSGEGKQLMVYSKSHHAPNRSVFWNLTQIYSPPSDVILHSETYKQGDRIRRDGNLQEYQTWVNEQIEANSKRQTRSRTRRAT